VNEMRLTASWHKIRLRQFLIVSVVSTVTVACHHTTSGNDTQPWPPAGKGAAVISSAGDPCAGGPAGCMQVGRADVDGDGQLDRIGVAVEKRPGENEYQQPGTIFVRVTNSVGVQAIQADALQLPKTGSPTDVFVGAFLMSRPRGADLVIQTRSDFLTEMFAVIGWSNGTLTMLPAPPARGSAFAGDHVWKLTQSEGFRDSVICTDGTGINMVHDIAPLDEGVPVPGGGRRETSRYAFDNNEWVFKSFQNTPKDQFSYNAAGAAFLCGDQRR
jgi:hypothetical protein